MPAPARREIPPNDACPCGSGQPFSLCCQPVLDRQRPAATAEELMRSRFTAHVVRDFEHLHRTYLPTAKEPFVPEKEDVTEMDWTRLEIHEHVLGPQPETAFVDFTAYHRTADGGEQALHEKAEFKQIDRTWYYTRAVRFGPAPIRSSQPKIGRNEPCPCGSGKKYKHCCGR